MSKELTDSMKNKTLPDGNYFCRTKLHCIDVFQYYDDNFFAFADANPIYYIDEVLAPCDYNHFVELTEKVKELEGTAAKLKAVNKYCANAKQYVGVAYDEPERVKRAREAGKLTPLADWKMSEKDCLEYCYQHGFDWKENGVQLYKILDRVSCWCCANKNLKELRNYYKFLPEYWEKLKRLQKRTDRPFKKSGSIFELEKRFEKEALK